VFAALAAADAFRGDPSSPAVATASEEATGRAGASAPASPERGVLSGTLFLTTLGGCRLQAIDAATLELASEGRETKCSFSVSPEGARAVVPLGPVRGPLGRSRAIWLARLEGGMRLLRRLGLARTGAASWSPDGTRLAWCRDDGHTVVLVLAGGARKTVAGCGPTFAADGSVLTRPDEPLTPRLLREGDVLLGGEDLRRGFPPGPRGPLDVLGYDARPDGLLAVAVVRFSSGRQPTPVLQLWRGDRLLRAVELPQLGSPAGRGRFGERVEFSPDGREIVVAFPGSGVRFVLLEVASGRLLLPPESQHGVAWSPDGEWFALSTAEEILLYGRGRHDAAYALPIGASALAWR
jgi:hypothetical protein